MKHASLPLKFWDYAFTTIEFQINRLPSSSLNFDVPRTILFKHSPDYTVLKTFGCACFPFLRPYNRHKLDYRSQKCLFLGYSSSHKGYKCLTSLGRLFISKDMAFNETRFPYTGLSRPSSVSSNTLSSSTHCSLQFIRLVSSSPTPSPYVSVDTFTSNEHFVSSPPAPNSSSIPIEHFVSAGHLSSNSTLPSIGGITSGNDDCWISPVVTFWSIFSLCKYVQGKSGLLESAPDRQVSKIKTEESEYRTQGTSLRQG